VSDGPRSSPLPAFDNVGLRHAWRHIPEIEDERTLADIWHASAVDRAQSLDSAVVRNFYLHVG
jgi:hypothetical protein